MVARLVRRLRAVSARGWTQLTALVISNAAILSALSFIPCGYLQCSNCAISTFACPLILVQRGAVIASMGMFGAMSGKILASVGGAAAMLALFGALVGSWGCGWLCPFGFVQDLLAKLPGKKFTLPTGSGYARLPILLGAVVALPYLTKTMFFCDVCPPGAINRLWQGAAGIPLFFTSPEGLMAAASFGLLAAVLAVSVFVHRPFCTLLCPIGGVVGLFNKVSGLHLALDREGCTSCGKCRRACPQGLDPAKDPNHSLCTRCLACTGSCEHIGVDLRL